MISQLTALPVLMGAPAANGQATGGGMFTTFMTFGIIILIFYFLIIRPQKKKERQTKEMLSALKKGDKVVSIGGVRGTVLSVREATVLVKVDDNTKLEFSKAAISNVLNPASQKGEQGKEEEAQSDSQSEEKQASGKKGSAKAKNKAAESPETPAEVQDEQPGEEKTK